MLALNADRDRRQLRWTELDDLSTIAKAAKNKQTKKTQKRSM
jgi:hypothetical protein